MLDFGVNIHSFVLALENIGFFIEIVDHNGVYVYASPACIEYTNEDAKSIVGKKASDVLICYNQEEPHFIKSLNGRLRPFKNIPKTYIKENKKLYTVFDQIPIILNDGFEGILSISKYYSSTEDVKNYIQNLEDNFIYEAPRSSNVVASFDDIITKDATLLEIIEQCKQIAVSETRVLILGDTGTGKELIAHSIHNASRRKNRVFIAINCSAIPEGLFESTFFGSVKGAYTDAIKRKGLFEEANGGTLFLDELNSLSMPLMLEYK